MTFLGVFRDDFYNAINVLPQSQYSASTLASGSVVPAALLSGAGDCYINASGGAAVAWTTDSAINIIAAIQTAVATAYKAGLGAFAAGVNPPPGVPNLFNVSWTLTINNFNSGTLTLSAPAGVTITGTATILTSVQRQFLITITSPTTVTLQSIASSTIAA